MSALVVLGLATLAGVPAFVSLAGVALVLFNALGVFVVYLVQRFQVWLPWNPQSMVNVSMSLPRSWNCSTVMMRESGGWRTAHAPR